MASSKTQPLVQVHSSWSLQASRNRAAPVKWCKTYFTSGGIIDRFLCTPAEYDTLLREDPDFAKVQYSYWPCYVRHKGILHTFMPSKFHEVLKLQLESRFQRDYASLVEALNATGREDPIPPIENLGTAICHIRFKNCVDVKFCPDVQYAPNYTSSDRKRSAGRNEDVESGEARQSSRDGARRNRQMTVATRSTAINKRVARYPTIVIEICHTQKINSVEKKAYDYLVGSEGAIRMVICVKAYEMIEPEVWVWQLVWEEDEDESERTGEWVVKAVVAESLHTLRNQPRKKDLVIPLSNVCPLSIRAGSSDDRKIRIPYADLCRMVDRAREMDQEAGEAEKEQERGARNPYALVEADEHVRPRKRSLSVVSELSESQASVSDDSDYEPRSPVVVERREATPKRIKKD